jgi:hypothetical protein
MFRRERAKARHPAKSKPPWPSKITDLTDESDAETPPLPKAPTPGRLNGSQRNGVIIDGYRYVTKPKLVLWYDGRHIIRSAVLAEA